METNNNCYGIYTQYGPLYTTRSGYLSVYFTLIIIDRTNKKLIIKKSQPKLLEHKNLEDV